MTCYCSLPVQMVAGLQGLLCWLNASRPSRLLTYMLKQQSQTPDH